MRSIQEAASLASLAAPCGHVSTCLQKTSACASAMAGNAGQSCSWPVGLSERGVPSSTSKTRSPMARSPTGQPREQLHPAQRRSLGRRPTGVSALIEDLERAVCSSQRCRGLGGVGRTPAHHGSSRRDHWPIAFSVVLAGAACAAELIHGASDVSPPTRPATLSTPGDLAATLFWRFGFDPGPKSRSD